MLSWQSAILVLAIGSLRTPGEELGVLKVTFISQLEISAEFANTEET
jgi:hypothetical protein